MSHQEEISITRAIVSPAICRVFVGDDVTKAAFNGTAFAVGPRAFLTAYHVVENRRPDQVFLGGPVYDPIQGVIDIKVHPKADAALIILDAAAPACDKPIEISESGLQVDDVVELFAFLSESQSLEGFASTVAAYEGSVTQFIAKKGVAPGMSGGLVAKDAKVAGLIVARNVDKADSYLISLDSIRDWLEGFKEHLEPIAALTDDQQAFFEMLKSDDDRNVSCRLVEAVKLQKAVDLTSHRLKRVAHWMHQDFELDKRFVNLILLLDHGMQNEAGRFIESGRYEGLEALLEARQDDVALVLLGRPGCGKTTLLRHFEYEQSLKALLQPKSELPFVFLVPLNAWKQDGEFAEDLFRWLSAEWNSKNDELPSLEELLQQSKKSYLLLDALNEIPHQSAQHYKQRIGHIKAALEWLRDHYPNVRVVFSCRSLDYSASLSDEQRITVPQVKFEDLSEKAIQAFLQQRLPDDWECLWEHLKGTTQLKLEKTPFYLDLEVKQFLARGRTAHGPAELMSGLVWQSLKNELSKNTVENTALGDLQLLSERDRKRVVSDTAWKNAPHKLPSNGQLMPALKTLAFAMQQKQGGGKQIRVDLDQADEWMAVEGDLGERIRAAAWQLDLLNTDLDHEHCVFHHQLLQEYLAGQRLSTNEDLGGLSKSWKTEDMAEMLEAVRDSLAMADPLPGPPASGWEETTLHAAAISPEPDAFVTDIANQDLVLAGRCALSPEVVISDSLRIELRNQLLDRSQSPDADLRSRIEAALVLGDLGDPRFQKQMGKTAEFIMPPLASVEAGAYSIGSKDGNGDEQPVHEVELEAFEIGQYLVTNAEWQCFMDDGGYEDERWWITKDAKRWQRGELENTYWIDWYRNIRKELQADFEGTVKKYPNWTDVNVEAHRERLAWSDDDYEAALQRSFGAKKHRQPSDWGDPDFNRRNQPVVGICWFEANAYCAWLSHQSGRAFRLPSEAEREAVSRVKSGDVFPWGSEESLDCANTYESHIRRISPVGVFPGAGKASQPLFDLAGNAWEWTASLYEDYPIKPNDRRDESEKEGFRVLRGGAWNSRASFARCSYRFGNSPDNRNDGIGFRMWCSPPSLGTDH